jgi:hypothetical protein
MVDALDFRSASREKVSHAGEIIVVDDAVGQQPRAFAPELLLLIGSDSQFAAVGIRDRAHQFAKR